MKRKGIRSERAAESLTAYLMLLPDVLGILLFVFAPMLVALVVSLHKWDGMTPPRFTGLANYVKLLHDEAFWRSLWITLKYTLMYVPSVLALSLALALLIKSFSGFAHALFQTAFFIPYSISIVVASLVWTFLYDPTRGYLNAALEPLGITGLTYLASARQALPAVAVVGIWLAIGFNIIIYLAALKDVPPSYYEAARMDGAGGARVFRSITFPLLRNTHIFVAVVTTIGSFQVFDQIKIMTNGGPASATNVTVFYIYRQAFEVSKIGYSSAVAFVLFIVILALSLGQLRVFSERGEQ